MTIVDPSSPSDRDLGHDAVAGQPLHPGPAAHRAMRVLMVLGCLAALILMYVVAVRTQLGQRIDNAAVLQHHLDRTPDGDVSTSDRILLLATVALAPIVLWCGRANRRRLIVNVCAVAGAVLLAEASRELLTRPALGRFDPLYGASYPSGHAAAAMGLALAVVALADGAWVRRLLPVVPGFVVALALAVPIHRPSDLAAGFLMALGAMIAAQWFDRDSGRQLVPLADRGWWRAALARSVVLTAVLLGAESLALRRAHLTLGDLGWTFPAVMLALVIGSELTIALFRRTLSECAA